MEEQEMEITLEKETKGEKMLSYLSTSFSQASREKREEDVQMSTTPISIPTQNNPKGVRNTSRDTDISVPLNINSPISTATDHNSKSGDKDKDPSSSNTCIRSCPTSQTASNSTYCLTLLDNDISSPTNTNTTTKDTSDNGKHPSNLFYPRLELELDSSRCESETATITTQDDNSQISLSLLELAWEDILFSQVFIYLSWKDLFHLRGMSSKSREMIDHYFNKMKRADLSQYSSVFNSNAFKVISPKCSNLRAIILPDCLFVNDVNLTMIFKNNRLLSHVDLSGCTALSGSCLLAVCVNCKLVKVLKLRGCTWLSKGVVDTIILHLRQIVEIDLSGCSALSNQQFIPFVQSYPGLKKIYLRSIQFADDSTLVALSRSCRGLLTLDITNCMNVTDHGIRSVGEYCTELKELLIGYSHRVTENGLKVLRRKSDLVIDRPVNGLALAHPWLITRRLQV